MRRKRKQSSQGIRERVQIVALDRRMEGAPVAVPTVVPGAVPIVGPASSAGNPLRVGEISLEVESTLKPVRSDDGSKYFRRSLLHRIGSPNTSAVALPWPAEPHRPKAKARRAANVE